MQLIDKQDDVSITVLDFFQNCFQTLFKFTTILGTCNQCSHIQCKYFFIFQSFRYITTHDTLCQTFYCCCLTNTRFTDQNRVVLCLTWQDTDHIPDLCITSDDRIQLLLPGFFYQIFPVFVQGIISSFRIITGYSLITSYRRKYLKEAFPCDSKFLHHTFDLTVRIFQKCEEQMLNRYIFITHLLCLILAMDQHIIQILTNIHLTALYLRTLP